MGASNVEISPEGLEIHTVKIIEHNKNIDVPVYVEKEYEIPKITFLDKEVINVIPVDKQVDVEKVNIITVDKIIEVEKVKINEVTKEVEIPEINLIKLENRIEDKAVELISGTISKILTKDLLLSLIKDCIKNVEITNAIIKDKEVTNAIISNQEVTNAILVDKYIDNPIMRDKVYYTNKLLTPEGKVLIQ